MKTARTLLAGLCVGLAAAANAQSVSISPAFPLTTDTVTLLYRPGTPGTGFCSGIVPGGLIIDSVPESPPEVIGVAAIDVIVESADHCTSSVPTPLTLGRFPTGQYEVRVFEMMPGDQPGRLSELAAFGSFTVQTHRLDALRASAPRDNYSGHWTTDVAGEGVTIAQQGETAFMSFLTYGDDGRATWYVVPDARYSVEAGGAGRFDGRIYAASGSPGVIGAGLRTFPGVVELGSAVLREETADAATLQINFGDTLQVERRIARLRF